MSLLRKDLLITFITQFLLLAISLWVYRLFKLNYGDLGFSEYALFKRSSGYLNTFFLLGIGIALPREIALELGRKKSDPSIYFVSALVLVLLLVSLLLPLGLIFKNELAFLLFGGTNYSHLIPSLLILVTALLFQTSMYGYFRGYLRMREANIYQFFSLGIIPILAFFVSSSVKTYFLYQGSLSIILFLTTLIFVRNEAFPLFSISEIVKGCKCLLGYGIQRMPGDFALGSLLALPAILLTHNQGVIEAGYVAFGISLLKMVGQLFGPIGLVYLPKISRLVGERNFTAVKNHTSQLFLITFFVSLTGVGVFQIFSQEILYFYLDEVDSKLNSTARTVMFTAVFYAIYVSMRSIVDATYKRAYNTLSVVFALIVFLIIYSVGHGAILGLQVALFLQAFLTICWLLPFWFPKVHRLKS